MYEFFLYVSFGYDPVCTHWLQLFFLPCLQLFFVKLLSDFLDFIPPGSLVFNILNLKKRELKHLTGCTSGEPQNLYSVILKSSVRNLLLERAIPPLPCSLPVSSAHLSIFGISSAGYCFQNCQGTETGVLTPVHNT